MSITKDLGFEISPEMSLPLSGYHMENSGGVECEVGEFLYGLVRMVQPDNICETGTHLGVGASYMGLALKENGKGKLTTLEFIPELRNQAVTRFEKLGLTNQIDSILIDAAAFNPTTTFDIILLDTEPQTRFAELIKYLPSLKPGGYIFIHDLSSHMHQVPAPTPDLEFGWPYGKLPQQIIDWVKDDVIRPFHFRTPRGLTGFYKVAPEDYKWL